MTIYHVFKEEEKYGLRYSYYETNLVVLEPVYTSIRIHDEDLDLQPLLTTEAWEQIDNSLLGIGEYTNYAIVEADGKQGLVSWGKIVVKFQFERIIKLSWRHYLCKKGTTYRLYDHFGYDDKKYPTTIELLATVTIQGELTLTRFMKELQKVSPGSRKELNKYLQKNEEKPVYTSLYRCWNGRLGSHCIIITAATQKACIEDNFNTTLLEVEL